VLFGGNRSFGAGAVGGGAEMVGASSTIPELMVDENGQIRMPFAGSITAAGRTPQQVERQIAARLRGMAHDPQVSVRIAQNMSSTVAVVGEVGKSGRVPITPTGERLLDVISLAGGPSQPVGKVMVQVARGGRVASQPLEDIIRDPAQNIRVGRNDVVTLHYQPYSFTALGAASKTGEIPFESTGLTLATALGRVGGLRDERANARGAFIFRFEDPAAVDPAVAAVSPRTPDGRIPIIYRADFRDPATLFAAQNFPMRDEDILYVASAPISDLQRFVGILSSMAFTFIGLGEAIPRVAP
jgi:polysaccharide export outer membrane protein